MMEMQGSTGMVPPEATRPVVLQVVPDLQDGGLQRSAVDIAEALTAAGCTAVVASAGGPLEHRLTRAGAIHESVPLASRNPASIYSNIQRLIDVIERHQVDIVHARARAPGWSALTAAQRSGRHFVTSVHAAYPDGNLLQRRYNAVLVRGERVIATSQFIADYLRENHSVDPTRLRLIRRGVDLKSFSPESVSNERLIKRVNDWRLPDGQPVVMLPARLERRKGQSLLLEAVAKLGDLEFVCLLVGADSGRGNYRRELDELIQRYELAHRCVVLEHCDDMPAGYKVANVVVAAGSEPQSFVRTISEAQAMGRPVVTVDHGGAGEQVIAGHTAFLAPPNDAAGLASAIRRALELTEEQRERLAEEAITFTRRHFSRDEMCAQTLALYDEILRQAMAAAAS